jgi:3-hydroxymyristoyl/3-hydroxydecanoyl-(acyl carrier protein) dehydratase
MSLPPNVFPALPRAEEWVRTLEQLAADQCRVFQDSLRKAHAGQMDFLALRDRALLLMLGSIESGGIPWTPEAAEYRRDARLDPPRLPCPPTSFDRGRVDAWLGGRPFDCFGPGYEYLLTHTRTPRCGPAPGRLQFFDEVTHCDARGGPWGRGYLRVRKLLNPDDPCMPGSLMFEGALQVMAFYLTWLGYTLDRDGWRFEPVQDETYPRQPSGQVVPSRELVCELFVEEVHDGDEPTLYADLLGTVDGRKAFHCRRLGLRLAPDWPLRSMPDLLAAQADPRPFATAGDVRGDRASLLACAWGKPSDAFGSMYRVFDGARRPPRLPGPPYHFLSRITHINATAQQPRPGASIEAEYDVPADAWYFQDQAPGGMPFCVLMEVNLQPCGWLATFLGFTLRNPSLALRACGLGEDLFFRNLDGTATVHRPVLPGAGTLRTRVTLTRFAEFQGVVIVSFETACWREGEPVCRLETSFGFFTADALARQVGLPASPQERAAIDLPGGYSVELTEQPPRYFAGPLRLAAGPLRMIDRVTGYWPEGGRAGLGRLVAEQTVDPAAWYFKAHFYQDPVQAGSLGVEAMIQLLQFYLIEKKMHEGGKGVFEPIATEREVAWKYRGQVVPRNKGVQVEMEVTEAGCDERGPYAVADAWLWVDGMRIYHVRGLGVRVVPAAEPEPVSVRPVLEEVFVLDPAADRWLEDHRPTFTVPAAPMMWMAEVLGRAAHRHRPEGKVVRVEGLKVVRWLVCEGPRRLRASSQPQPGGEERYQTRLEVWEGAAAGGRWETVALAVVTLADGYPQAGAGPDPLEDAKEVDIPYAKRAMFHGPAFHLLRGLRCGSRGSTALLDAGGPEGAKDRGAPVGLLHPALLDCIWHSMTRANLCRWLPDLAANRVAYPTQIDFMEFYGPTPSEGTVTCDVRLELVSREGERPGFRVAMHHRGDPWMHARVAVLLEPLGGFSGVSEEETAAFLEGRRPLNGRGVSSHERGVTRLSTATVRSLDFLPGTMARAFRACGDLKTLTLQIAVKEHLARTLGVHPAEVAVDEGLLGESGPIRVAWDGEEVVVSGS